MNKLKERELLCKLCTMYSYAIAHIIETGVSEERQKEFTQTFSQIVALIKKRVA